MILNQFPEKGILPVCQQIIEPDAAADKDLFDPGNRPQLPQKRYIVAVIGVHIFAGSGEEALPPGAGAFFHLLLAGRVPEVGSGTAHIVNVAFEVRILYHFFRFPEN